MRYNHLKLRLFRFFLNPKYPRAERVNENCHNSKTSHNIDMELGPATVIDRRKKFDDDFLSTNCDVIVFFPIYGQFAAIRKLDSRRMVYKTYIFLSSNLLSYKTW